ncbi:MAG: hypothetical protein IK126_03300 [Bacteroidales bacterium]|nr:hypothetical protein [Bacteroidales bacterium]
MASIAHKETLLLEYNNEHVYDFLVQECMLRPYLWDNFGEGLMSHTTNVEFWDNLSEELDCFRVCVECGKPMIEGFVVDGHDTYCSEKCLHNHHTEEEFNKLYDDGNGDTYWTTWYEDSLTFKSNNK